MTEKPEVAARETEVAPRIVVVGVGGAGGNAVNNMIESELAGVEFLVTNTDAQALHQSQCKRCIQLGRGITRGLGAGSQPEVGRAATEEALEEIMGILEGANMAFITAGMGGGTGTGGAPVVARAAREAGILTVGVVTKPFQFEGARRMRMAEAGIAELSEFVDTLIVIPNQNLFRLANEKTTFSDAFKMADRVLHSGVRGVTDLMVMPGLINLDFADIRAVMTEMGKAIMGTGEGEGERRALAAAEAAISNPLLDDVSMQGARGVLINITGGLDLTLFEVDQAANRIREEVDPDANIIFGSIFDPSMEGQMRVSVVATGIGAEKAKRPRAVPISLVINQRPGKTTVTPPKEAEPAPAAKPIAPEPTVAGPVERTSDTFASPAPAVPVARTSDSAAEKDTAADKSFFARLAPADAAPTRQDTRAPDPQADDAAQPPVAETTAHSEPAAAPSPQDQRPEPELATDLDDDAEPAREVDADLIADETEEPELVLSREPVEKESLTAPVSDDEAEAELSPERTGGTGAPRRKRRSNGIFSWMTGGGANAEELFEKGDRYYHGQGVRKNLALAFRAYRKAAELGHAGAQNRLGWMYEKGEGVDAPDYAQAAAWYRRAAEQDHVNAMNDLGYMYRQGWGVPQDYNDAIRWFRKAAEKFDCFAEYNLGQMYENGWGVEKDLDEAVHWFRRSAARGHEWAAKRLEELDIPA